MPNAVQTQGSLAASHPQNANSLTSFFQDRWVLIILGLGLLLRIAVAAGLHLHFSTAHPPHLWPTTDEASYYEFGSRSAVILREQGWYAFSESPPRSEYFNWAHFKYTGLILYLAGDSPFTLRLLSIAAYMSSVVLFCRSIGRSLPGKTEFYFFLGTLTLLPSTIFWSALAIKEGILSLLVSVLCWLMVRAWSMPRPWIGLSLLTLGCFVLGTFRIWAGLACFSVFAICLLFFHPGRPALSVLLPIVVILVVCASLIPSVQLLIAHDLLQKQPVLGMQMYSPTIQLSENAFLLEGHEYPLVIKPVMAWLLPLPFASNRSVFMQFAGFENLFILALSALALNGACRKLSAIEASWLCVCTIFIFIAVAFGTNLGTIYRIKGTVIPFLAYFAACGLPALLKKVRFPSPQLH